MRRRFVWLAISGLIIVVGATSLSTRGLNLGIDFKGGTQVTFKTPQATPISHVRSEVGKIGSEAYLKAPAALASLAGQGVGESISAAGTGVSGLSAASSGLASLGGLQIEQAQFQAQQKGSMLGGLGTIAQTVGSVASSQIGGLSWTDALAALA